MPSNSNLRFYAGSIIACVVVSPAACAVGGPAAIAAAQGDAKALPTTYVVANFHPASCGWLANWSVERNYCANSCLNHLDRVRDDANYNFAMSECNNMIAIANFRPERFDELRRRVKEGRLELVNAFFLEPTINLSGGEALAKMGVEGLRWQEQVLGTRPRFCWAIDVCGAHAQMPQICQQLGLDAMLYNRCSRAAKAIFWSESPDGSRVLTIAPGGYSVDFGGVFSHREPVSGRQLTEAARQIAAAARRFPGGSPLLILGGYGDYALAPVRKQNPTEFLQKWKSAEPRSEVRFATPGKFLDALLARVQSGKIGLATVKGGTRYTYDSFWIQSPTVKTWYRRDEHALQAAETLATIASLTAGFKYPAQELYHAWLQMLLNMDRNTLWGAAGGMVFEDKTSWDARDRFQWVEEHSKATIETAARKLTGEGEGVAIFNPASFPRSDVLRLRLPAGKTIAGMESQALDDGTVLCQTPIPSCACQVYKLADMASMSVAKDVTPDADQQGDHTEIATPLYVARFANQTGALEQLELRSCRRGLLSGPANVIVAEEHRGRGDPGDDTTARPLRPRRGSSSDAKSKMRIRRGPVATIVQFEGPFLGGTLKRTTYLYEKHPRIDFETEITDIPDNTVVVAEFPLAETPSIVRRGIPFGFATESTSQATAAAPEVAQGIEPAVRWSHYTLPGHPRSASGHAGFGGLALLDRGLSGRELNGKVPVIYLFNAHEKYYGYTNSWLSGKGRHKFEYAIVPDDGDWDQAQVARRAWEYNCPVAVIDHCAPAPAKSFCETSGNVIMEVLRRERGEMEMRLIECLGHEGEAWVKIGLPHEKAALTDFVGGHRQPLTLSSAGRPRSASIYRFSFRPQQIITLRMATKTSVDAIQPLLDWEPLVPVSKRSALHLYLPSAVGHPPRG